MKTSFHGNIGELRNVTSFMDPSLWEQTTEAGVPWRVRRVGWQFKFYPSTHRIQIFDKDTTLYPKGMSKKLVKEAAMKEEKALIAAVESFAAKEKLECK